MTIEFETYKEFYSKCEYIKGMYDLMSVKSKWEYKKYVYSHKNMKEYKIDRIWEYLNNDKDKFLLYVLLQVNSVVYRIYKDFGKGYEDVEITKNKEVADSYTVEDCMKMLIISRENNTDDIYKFETNNDYFEKRKVKKKK